MIIHCDSTQRQRRPRWGPPPLPVPDRRHGGCPRIRRRGRAARGSAGRTHGQPVRAARWAVPTIARRMPTDRVYAPVGIAVACAFQLRAAPGPDQLGERRHAGHALPSGPLEGALSHVDRLGPEAPHEGLHGPRPGRLARGRLGLPCSRTALNRNQGKSKRNAAKVHVPARCCARGLTRRSHRSQLGNPVGQMCIRSCPVEREWTIPVGTRRPAQPLGVHARPQLHTTAVPGRVRFTA